MRGEVAGQAFSCSHFHFRPKQEEKKINRKYIAAAEKPVLLEGIILTLRNSQFASSMQRHRLDSKIYVFLSRQKPLSPFFLFINFQFYYWPEKHANQQVQGFAIAFNEFELFNT